MTHVSQAMDEQYANTHNKNHDTFMFAENTEKLEIHYDNELPGGWLLTLQGSPEVSLVMEVILSIMITFLQHSLFI